MMTVLMTPDMANFTGNVHGGTILKLLDQVAYACAARYAGRYVVTLSVDQVMFREAIHVGELVTAGEEDGPPVLDRERAVGAVLLHVQHDACTGARVAHRERLGERLQRLARHERDPSLIKQDFRQFRRVLGERAAAIAVGQMRGDIGERIERASGPFAGDSWNGTQAFDDALSAFFVLSEHHGNRVHRAAHGFQCSVR